MCVCRTKHLGAASIARRSVQRGSFLGHGRNYWSNLASLVPHLQCRKFKKFKRQRTRLCSQKQIDDNSEGSQRKSAKPLPHGKRRSTSTLVNCHRPWRPLETRMQMKQKACSAYEFGLSTLTSRGLPRLSLPSGRPSSWPKTLCGRSIPIGPKISQNFSGRTIHQENPVEGANLLEDQDP